MAITRAQIARQLYQFGGGADAGGKDSPGGGDFGGGGNKGGNGDNNRERGIQASYQEAARRGALKNLATRQAEDKAEEAVEVFRSRNRGGAFNKVLDFLPGIRGAKKIASTFGPLNTRDFLLDKVLDAGRFNYKGNILTKQQFANLTEEEKEDVLDSYLGQRGLNEIDAYGNPIGDGGGDGQQFIFPQRLQASAPSITKQEEEKDKFNFRLLAEGGRAGFQEGGGIEQRLEQLGGDVTSAEQMLQAINKRLETAESSLGSGGGGLGSIAQPFIGGIAQPLPAAGPNVGTLIPQPRPGPFMGRPILEPSLIRPINATLPGTLEAVQPLEAANPADIRRPNEFDSLEDAYKDAQTSAEAMRTGGSAPIIDATTGKFIPYAGELSFDDFSKNFSLQDNILTQNPDIRKFQNQPVFSTTTDPNFFNIKEGGVFKTPAEFAFKGSKNPQETYLSGIRERQEASGIPAVGFADGGNVVGGIMDLESARQMYGLGKLVKKVTRTVKKIAKSPIGKAALAFGAYKLGGMGFGKSGLSLFERFGDLTALQKAGVISSGILTASPFFMKQKQENIIPGEEGADIDDPKTIMDNPYAYLNVRNLAEGGSTEKEPVAKKTMPLLDMGGMEKDYREDGGFVPIGRMEKADDVPARLSKNEFVFTADAVRNAGDGNVDKGAEVMYNMMKNLEAGGEVSEESQGLEGARKMFQTSQRLGEVV